MQIEMKNDMTSNKKYKMKLLNYDLKWVFGVIVTIVMGVNIIYFSNFHFTKELTFKEVYSFSLLDKSASLADSTSINFRGKKLKNLESVIIEFENSGNKPILNEDFERNITFKFSDSTKIIRVDFLKLFPSSLAPKKTINDNEFSISPLLLNPGDIFVIQIFYVSNFPEFPKINARIANINDLVKKVDYDIVFVNKIPWSYLPLGILSFVFFALASIWYIKGGKPNNIELICLSVILANSGFTCIGLWGDYYNFIAFPVWINILLALGSICLIVFIYLYYTDKPNDEKKSV